MYIYDNNNKIQQIEFLTFFEITFMRGYEHLETAEIRVEFKSCLRVMITVFADQDLEESFIYSASLLLALESYCLRILCLPLLERLLPSGETDPRAPHRRLEVNLPDALALPQCWRGNPSCECFSLCFSSFSLLLKNFGQETHLNDPS